MTWFDVFMSYATLVAFAFLAADSYVRSRRPGLSEGKQASLLTVALMMVALMALGLSRLIEEMVRT